MKLSRALLAVGLALLAVPSGAAAAESTAPPGNAGVDQYRESAPPSSGNSRKLDRKQRSSLSAQGKDGKALADALDRNGGVTAVPGDGGSGGSTGGGSTTGGSAKGDSGKSSSGKGSKPSAGRGSSDDAPTVSTTEAAPKTTTSGSVTESAATSTVGPFPIWTMLVAALVVVGIGLVVRRRPSA